MSVHVTSWAWKQQAGDATSKLILVKLADNSNDHGIAWPSQGRICKECEIPLRTVQRHLAALEERGLISRKRRRRQSTVYQLMIRHSGVSYVDLDPPEKRFHDPPPDGVLTISERSSPPGASAQALTARFVDLLTACGQPAPKRVVGQMAQTVKGLLDEGFPPGQIEGAIDRMFLKGLHQPSLLPSFLIELPSGKTPSPAQRKTGWRRVRGSHGETHIPDPDGTDRPPVGWQA